MTDNASIGSHCARCLRPAPSKGDSGFIYWEVLDAEAQLMICPECITPQEQQAMEGVDVDFVDEIGEWEA